MEEMNFEEGNFEEDTDGNLIELVHNFPILWNSVLKEFRDETKKINAWESVAEAMLQPVATVQADWRRLRNRFTRTIRASDLPSGSGAATGSRWEHLNSLMFLKGIIRPRKTSGKPQKRPSSAISKQASSSNSRDVFDVDEASLDDPSPISNRDVVSPEAEAGPSKRQCTPATPISSKRSAAQPLGEFENCLIDSLKHFRSMAPAAQLQKKTTNELLGMTMVSILDSLSPAKQIDLQTKLLHLCFEAQQDQ